MCLQRDTRPGSIYRKVRMHTLWLSFTLISLLLLLSSCGNTTSTATQTRQPAKTHSTSRTSQPTHTSSNDTTQTNTDRRAQLALLHNFLGPSGWTWRTSLPDNRLVIYYGNPL